MILKYLFNKLNNIKIITLYLVLIFTFFYNCSKDIPNAILNSYDGDYELEINWENNIDTFFVLKPYVLKYYSTGKDTFDNISLITNPDTLLYEPYLENLKTDSTMTVYFIKSGLGNIHVVGHHPNGKKTEKKDSVIIFNPFKIIGNKELLSNTTDTLRISNIFDTSFTASWYVNNILKENLSILKPFTLTNDKAITDTIFAIISDTLKNQITTDTTFVTFIKSQKPICNFIQTNLKITIYDSVELNIETNDPNKNSRIIKTFYSTNIDSTPILIDTNKTWTITFDNPGTKTINCWVIDNNGFISDTAKAIINVTTINPYFERLKIDTTVFINDSILISVNALVTNKNDSIVKYLWDINNDSLWDTVTTIGTIIRKYSSVLVDSIHVCAVNQRDDSTTKNVSVFVNVQSGKPNVNLVSLSSSIIYVNDNVNLRIIASDINGTINKINVKINNKESTFIIPKSDAIDTSLVFTFNKIGKYLFSVSVFDDDTIQSDYISAKESLSVNDGTPIITELLPKTSWINDSTVYTLSALDLNGSVVHYFIKWDSTKAFEHYTESTMVHTYLTDGVKKISAYVIDDENNTSDTTSYIISVNKGKPITSSITPDSVWIFKNNIYKIHASDSNGVIKKYYVSWDSTFSFEILTDSIFSHIYSTNGNKKVRIFTVDDDNIFSDTVEQIIHVRLGAPKVTGITANKNFDNIYVLDSLSFTFKGLDANDSIDSIFVSWNEDAIFEIQKKAVKDSITVPLYIPNISDSGINKFRVRVKDPNGLFSDSLFIIDIKSGAPIVDSISINSVWINDTNKYSCYIHDANGSIKNVYISWNGNNNADDSSNTLINSKYAEFNHAFELSDSGIKTIKIWAIDNNGITSSVYAKNINVKIGRPNLWGDSNDTLWIVADKGYGTYSLHINSLDTNGTIQKYFWALSEMDTAGATKSDTNTIPFDIDNARINKGTTRYIYGIDDDSLLFGSKFVVFADSAPIAPSVDKNKNADTITIYWRNEDILDTSNTQYRVLLHNGGEPDSTRQEDILSDWKTGYEKSDDPGYFYMYRFVIQNPSGQYYYQVHAKDSRGSISADAGNHSFFY